MIIRTMCLPWDRVDHLVQKYLSVAVLILKSKNISNVFQDGLDILCHGPSGLALTKTKFIMMVNFFTRGTTEDTIFLLYSPGKSVSVGRSRPYLYTVRVMHWRFLLPTTWLERTWCLISRTATIIEWILITALTWEPPMYYTRAKNGSIV